MLAGGRVIKGAVGTCLQVVLHTGALLGNPKDGPPALLQETKISDLLRSDHCQSVRIEFFQVFGKPTFLDHLIGRRHRLHLAFPTLVIHGFTFVLFGYFFPPQYAEIRPNVVAITWVIAQLANPTINSFLEPLSHSLSITYFIFLSK